MHLNSPSNFINNLNFGGNENQVLIPNSGFFKKLWAFMGPGLLISIAYIDPGNIDTDIRAGALDRYSLSWVILVSTFLGFFLQVLSAKLGIITGKDLALLCRENYPKRISYILWATAEITVISADIPEVIGTAMALKILFGLPLWIGVLITVLDTFLFLIIQYFGIRYLEAFISILISIICICFVIEMFLARPDFLAVIKGFVPYFERKDSILSAVAILGSVIMPHNLFLHSALVKSRKVTDDVNSCREAIFFNIIESLLALFLSFIINLSVIVLSGTKFYGKYPHAGLENAAELLKIVFGGRWAYIIFAICLFASGQSSTLTGTYAGQFIMEGFLEIRVRIWIRNLITRAISILPSLIITLLFQDGSTDNLIIISSCILSLQLPLTIIPLLRITSSPEKMTSEHANSLLIKILASLTSLVIISSNMLLMIQQSVKMLEKVTGSLRFFFFSIIAVTLLIYLGFLIYLYFFPLKPNTRLSNVGTNNVYGGDLLIAEPFDNSKDQDDYYQKTPVQIHEEI